jgi:hypothetical protein
MARGSSQRKRQSATDKEKSKKPLNGQPKSMVIRIGAQEVGSSVSQLVQDVRHVMEPDTAVRLKVRSISLSSGFLTNSFAGAKSQQASRLHRHGRSSRRNPSPSLLAIRVWQYKPAPCAHPSRSYTTLPRRELLAVQRYFQVDATPARWRKRLPGRTAAGYEQLFDVGR